LGSDPLVSGDIYRDHHKLLISNENLISAFKSI
jgi:hypothetical protein